MNFWEGFRDGFKGTHGEGGRDFGGREPPRPPPSDHDDRWEDYERLAAELAEREAEIGKLTAEKERLAKELKAEQRKRPPHDTGALREERDRLAATIQKRDAELTECKGLLEELAAEAQKLSEELKVRRRAEPQGKGDEKYKQLRRFVIKEVHPDRAGADKRLAAVLERICKAINAEIDRIDQS